MSGTGRLVPEYRRLHAEGRFPGISLAPWVADIGRLIVETGALTLLDYGCGKGLQYTRDRLHAGWGICPTLYDPAVPGLDARPRGRYDGVISTDVAEHIPADEIDGYVAALAAYARRFVFVAVCCRPAKRRFTDGMNVHVTVRPIEWWAERLQPITAAGLRLELREAP